MLSKYITHSNNFSNFVIIKTKENQLMMVNPQDQYISRSLMYTGEWEPHIINVLKEYIKEGMTVVDIGANIGAHTLIMSKLVGDNGKVIAFEPCKLNHTILIQNCMLNKCKNVDIYKLGCGDKKKSMFIESRWNNSIKEDNYGAIELHNDQKSKDDECIDIIPLDLLLTQKEEMNNIDCIKIDAEGMEDKVLEGGKELIKKYKPLMIVEIHPNDVKKVLPMLNELGYTVKQIGGIDFLAIPNVPK